MPKLSDDDAVWVAKVEGAGVAFERAREDFMEAAVNCIADREAAIIRKYPEFYSKEQVLAAGGSLRKRRFHGRYR